MAAGRSRCRATWPGISSSVARRSGPFSSKIHPFNWRGYQDYGCGALGDMACHLMDAAYWDLNLGAPTSVELKKIESPARSTFPKSAVVEYQFPARGKMPPVKLTWYEGGEKPEKPAQIEAERASSRTAAS